MGKQWKQWLTLFFWAPKSLQMMIVAMKWKTLTPWKESYDQSRHFIKSRHYFANKGPSSQGYGFSSRHVWMQELDYKESWAPKNWCFWTVVLEKTLQSPLDCKEIQLVHPKGDQSWVFIGRIIKAETPILWPPDAKSWLIGIDPDAGKDWGQEEKGMTEDKIVGWHHRLNRHGFGWTLGVGDGQGGLACCGSWGRKESDTTEQLNWTEITDAQMYSVHGFPYQDTHAVLSLRKKKTKQMENTVLGSKNPWNQGYPTWARAQFYWSVKYIHC